MSQSFFCLIRTRFDLDRTKVVEGIAEAVPEDDDEFVAEKIFLRF